VLIAQTLRRLKPDAALLQEVDSYFMASDWSSSDPLPCGERLPGYTAHASYSDKQEGCVVLLRDEALVHSSVKRFPATGDQGWKTAVVVHARRAGAPAEAQPIALASVHLAFGSNEAKKAARLASVVASCLPGAACVLAGDFNTWAGPALAAIEAPLAARGLVRMATPAGLATGLQGDLSWNPRHVIDHVYIAQGSSRLLTMKPPEVSALPRTHDQGPWGRPPHDGSDHAWIGVEILFGPPTPVGPRPVPQPGGRTRSRGRRGKPPPPPPPHPPAQQPAAPQPSQPGAKLSGRRRRGRRGSGRGDGRRTD
jgi:endonuclease/exonuclease/phosphatase family metal-dependent hydrolase